MDTGHDVPVAMPPQRHKRTQLNTRVRADIEQLLQRFVVDHNTTVQGSVDLALQEFLAARGYPLAAIDRQPPAAVGSSGRGAA